MASEIRVNSLTNRSGLSTVSITDTGAVIAGIVTATDAIFTGDIAATNGTFSGNVSIGGTLTYEDVTNIDSVGIITARAGINISGGNLQVGGTNVINSGRVLYNLEQIKLADAKELVLGSGNDLKIQHSGSHSFISQEGVGALKIKGDDIRFEDAGGTEALRITSAGNLGIGDVSPTKPLTVGTTTPVILLDDQSSHTLEIRGPSTTHNATVLTTSTHDLLLGTNNAERLRITSAGDMGLGTASPRSITNFGSFAINGTAGAFTDYFLNGTRTGTTAVDSNGFTSEAVGSSTPFRVITNGSERLRIHSTGVPQFTTTGTQYVSASVPAFVVNSNGDHALVLNNQNTTDPRGLFIYQDQDVNNGTSYFFGSCRRN